MDIEKQVCKLHNTVDNFSGGKIANYIDEWLDYLLIMILKYSYGYCSWF